MREALEEYQTHQNATSKPKFVYILVVSVSAPHPTESSVLSARSGTGQLL